MKKKGPQERESVQVGSRYTITTGKKKTKERQLVSEGFQPTLLTSEQWEKRMPTYPPKDACKLIAGIVILAMLVATLFILASEHELKLALQARYDSLENISLASAIDCKLKIRDTEFTSYQSGFSDGRNKTLTELDQWVGKNCNVYNQTHVVCKAG